MTVADTAASPFDSPEERDRFWTEHWRRRPYVVKGGATTVLPERWDDERFAELLAAARPAAERGELSIHEREDDVCFVETASAADPGLAQRAAELAAGFGAPRAWFDVIRTYRRSGIGSHFDHSDNIVLQQQGVKHWRLAPPSSIPREDYAARMMGLPGVGAQELPDDGVLEFTLEPGDLLYIPLMWIHSGVSEAGSLSISLVCPAQTLASVVLGATSRLLQQSGLGHQAVGTVPAWLDPAEAAVEHERLARAASVLLRHLGSDEVVDRVVAGLRP